MKEKGKKSINIGIGLWKSLTKAKADTGKALSVLMQEAWGVYESRLTEEELSSFNASEPVPAALSVDSINAIREIVQHAMAEIDAHLKLEEIRIAGSDQPTEAHRGGSDEASGERPKQTHGPRKVQRRKSA